mgnify:CR=1 FL=1
MASNARSHAKDPGMLPLMTAISASVSLKSDDSISSSDQMFNWALKRLVTRQNIGGLSFFRAVSTGSPVLTAESTK